MPCGMPYAPGGGTAGGGSTPGGGPGGGGSRLLLLPSAAVLPGGGPGGGGSSGAPAVEQQGEQQTGQHSVYVTLGMDWLKSMTSAAAAAADVYLQDLMMPLQELTANLCTTPITSRKLTILLQP